MSGKGKALGKALQASPVQPPPTPPNNGRITPGGKIGNNNNNNNEPPQQCTRYKALNVSTW